MRVSDLIAKFLVSKGIQDIFMVSGGGCMVLTDGLACNPDIRPVCCHHEQAAAMAAVGYAKYTGKPGCAYFTTGCGGTNAVTAVLHAWQDNTPCVFISGQCKRSETVRWTKAPVRQLGIQEADVVEIVGSITKMAVMVEDADQILYLLEKAFYLAMCGRRGPVWLDIPADIQSAEVDETSLPHFPAPGREAIKTAASTEEYRQVVQLLGDSQRPVLLVGQGIRLANAAGALRSFAEKYALPVVFSRHGFDALPTGHPLCIGAIGNKGTRAGNFAVQNADLVLVLGSRLSINSTGRDFQNFARAAKIVAVDIDAMEHKKNTVPISLFIQADVHDFLDGFPSLIGWEERAPWSERCHRWKEKYPACTVAHLADDSRGISHLAFCHKLSGHLQKDSVVVTDTGSACSVPVQVMRFTTEDQRYIPSSAQAEMGFTVPGAVGVCVARGGKDVLAITGEGSLQMNLQEFQTVVHHQFAIKLFVWNNNGYLSIKDPQKRVYGGRLIGSGPESGVTFPDLEKIACAYGIPYRRMDNLAAIDKQFEETLNMKGPVICEVMCIPEEELTPVVRSMRREDGSWFSCPLEDMYPYLSREELKENMVIPLLDA